MKNISLMKAAAPRKQADVGGLPDYSGYHLNDRERKQFFMLCSVGLFALGYLFYKSIFLSAILTFLAVPLKGYYEGHLAKRRRELLRSQFRDMLYSLSSSVSTGRQLPEAFSEARDQLLVCFGEEALLYKEVDYIVRSMKESHASLESLLESLAERSHIAEVYQFVQICKICKRTGGDMERAIGKTAAVLMEKIALKRELTVMTAQKRMEAGILTAIPIAMVFLLNLVSPDYLAVLYEGLGGRMVMTVALAGILLSAALCRRITELEG